MTTSVTTTGLIFDYQWPWKPCGELIRLAYCSLYQSSRFLVFIDGLIRIPGRDEWNKHVSFLIRMEECIEATNQNHFFTSLLTTITIPYALHNIFFADRYLFEQLLLTVVKLMLFYNQMILVLYFPRYSNSQLGHACTLQIQSCWFWKTESGILPNPSVLNFITVHIFSLKKNK